MPGPSLLVKHFTNSAPLLRRADEREGRRTSHDVGIDGRKRLRVAQPLAACSLGHTRCVRGHWSGFHCNRGQSTDKSAQLTGLGCLAVVKVTG